MSTTLYIPAYEAKTLDRWLKRWDRWQANCDAYRAKADTYDPKMRPPSKDGKHRAYSAAHALVRFLGADNVGIAHPSTVGDMRTVLRAWQHWQCGPQNGIDRCACGCKYWDGRRCHDCGDEFYPNND